MSNERFKALRSMRELMGTAPREDPPRETRFYRGVEGIRVQLLDGPRNPYKMMYCMATSTWGAGAWASDEFAKISKCIAERGYAPTAIERRWDAATPEMRFAVVNSALAMQALPLALEHAKFGFAIENLSRWAFDQIVRARLGVVYASMGTRDNSHLDMAFRMHESTFRDPIKLRDFVDGAVDAKERYADFVELGRGSWQEARTLLPISVVHRFTMSINYAALRSMCGKRMSFSEAEDTVAVAWMLRDRLGREDAYPLLARWLRPGCDWSGACNYHRAHTMSEAFGCLYRSCGRNPVKSAPGAPAVDFGVADGSYADFNFNEACSDRETIEKQCGIRIPAPDEARPSAEDGPEVLTHRDRELFGFPGAAPLGLQCRPAGLHVEPATRDEIVERREVEVGG